MKHTKLFTMALAALATFPALAQVKVNEFPKEPTFNIGQTPTTNQTPSAINDKALGQYMYAGQLVDQSKLPGWVRFRTSNAYDFQQLARYRQTIDHLGAMRMGAYDTENHKYYGIFSLEYTYSFYPTNFSEVDVATGDTTTIKNYTETEQDSWYNGTYLYAMAFDPASKTLYGLGVGSKQVGDQTYGFTKLYIIDPETGEREEVQDFDVIYYNFAFDYDGNAWFVQPKAGDDGITAVGTSLVKMDNNFNVVSSVELKSESNESYLMYYFGTMAFDYTNGQLYWLPVGASSATSLYKVDTTTGKYTTAANFYPGNSFVGLYIPYQVADSRKAPAQVTALDAQPDFNGALADTIKWINPTTAWDKSEINSLTGARIYRKKAGVATTELTTTEELLSSSYSELVATVNDVQPGKAAQWVDTKPLQGINTYYVLATNDEGKGVLDSIRCFIGNDVPGPVTNVKVTKKGDGLNVSWSAPEEGLNNGFIKPEDVTYTVTRFPDSTIVAKDITATSLEDDNLSEEQSYYYIIQGKNAAGEGAKVETEHVLAGKAISIPTSLRFTSEEDANRWTIPNSSLMWQYVGWEGAPEEYQALGAYGDYSEMEGYVISPPLYLEAGKTYRFTTDFWANYENPFDLKVGIGTNATSNEGATYIRDDKNVTYPYDHREKFEDTFTAPESGIYYYYLDVATHSQYNNFRLYGLDVDLIADNDLRAVSIDNIVEAVAGQDNSCTVHVRNNGGKDQKNYKVSIIANDEGTKTVLGTTTEVPEIKAGAYADVPVTFKPTKEGVFDFYGVVSLDGDENASNDTTAVKTLNVQPAGTTPWNTIVTSGENEGILSSVPIWNYDYNERSQSIYFFDEVNAPKGATITRLGYMYDGNEKLTDRTEQVAVKIYLGYANRDFFSTVDDKISDDQLTLVYEGDIAYEPGTNHLLGFTLDTPFEYDNTRNLVVVVDKEGNCGQTFAAMWHVFNNGMWSQARYRSLTYGGSGAFSGTYTGPEPAAPILYLGIVDATGISKTLVAGDRMDYNDGKLYVGSNVVSADIYTIDGKRIATVSGSQAQLNLAKGIYIVRAKTADGKVSSTKLNVNR